jgi:hypothetical protein
MSGLDEDVVAGYFDGFKDDRDELPAQTNYSRLYVHGWLNGRDDRLSSPRASAAELREIYAALKAEN